MISRRTFLGVACASALTGRVAQAAESRKKLAIVGTVYRKQSHLQHMADRFLVGYPKQGKWHEPELDVASLFVHQTPEGDLSQQRAKEFGFKIYPSIAEALRCGGDKLAVDGVLLIGEHGNYPRNKDHQTEYPRYEFFKEITEVFKKDGRSVPVFNDKHLS